jgi:hypothetical protein
MLIPSRAFGFLRVGLNGRFGVTVPNFGTGGTGDNPLLNDVDAGDEAANVEFCPVFAAQEASGTLTVYTDGSLSFVGAADGSYSIPYTLYTFTPGDAAASDDGATTYDVTIGSATELDIAADPLALTGTVAVSGDIEIGTSFDLAADAVALSGTLAVTGDIESSVAPVLDIEASALALSGTLALSGDLEFGTSFDLDAAALALAGTIGVSGDVEIGTSFDLAADPVALAGTVALAGDLDIVQAFDIEAAPLALSGTLSASGDFESSLIPVTVSKQGGRKKRKGNPFLRYEPAGLQAEEPKSEPAPVVAKAAPAAPKASGLLLGLIERAIAPPPPAAAPEPEPIKPAPVAPPKAEPAPAPEPQADPVAVRMAAMEAVFVARIAELESKVEGLLDTLTLTLQERLPPPPPREAPPAIEPEPDPEPLIKPRAAAEAPKPPTKPSRQDIAKENERRALALAKALL